MFRRVGVTFAVYGDKDVKGTAEETERLIPFDVVPRVIPAAEWKQLGAGPSQRVRALNRYLRDIYHDQEILRAGASRRIRSPQPSQYRPEMHGVTVGDIYAHMAGIDLSGRARGAGEYYDRGQPAGAGAASFTSSEPQKMMRLFSRSIRAEPHSAGRAIRTYCWRTCARSRRMASTTRRSCC